MRANVLVCAVGNLSFFLCLNVQEVRKSWAVRAAVAIFTVIAKEPEWNGVWFTQILRSCETRCD